MTQFAIALFTIFVALLAWVANFAIKEYPVFKKLKIPSTIFTEGGKFVILYLTWCISAQQVYSNVLPHIPETQLAEIKKSFSYLTTEKGAMYFMLTVWGFLWLYTFSISELAKSIHNARAKVKKEDDQAKE